MLTIKSLRKTQRSNYVLNGKILPNLTIRHTGWKSSFVSSALLCHLLQNDKALALLILAAASSNLAACTASNTQISAETATANLETIKTEKQAGKPLPMDHSGSMMSHDSMDLGEADSEYDLRFIDGMTPHHQGAINIA